MTRFSHRFPAGQPRAAVHPAALLTAVLLLLAPLSTSAQTTTPDSPISTLTEIVTPQTGSQGGTDYTPVQNVQHGQTVIVQTTIQTRQGSLRNINVDVPVLPQSGFLGIESVTPGVTLTYSLDGRNFQTVPFVTTIQGRVPARPREYRYVRMNIAELLPGEATVLRMIVTIN